MYPHCFIGSCDSGMRYYCWKYTIYFTYICLKEAIIPSSCFSLPPNVLKASCKMVGENISVYPISVNCDNILWDCGNFPLYGICGLSGFFLGVIVTLTGYLSMLSVRFKPE